MQSLQVGITKVPSFFILLSILIISSWSSKRIGLKQNGQVILMTNSIQIQWDRCAVARNYAYAISHVNVSRKTYVFVYGVLPVTADSSADCIQCTTATPRGPGRAQEKPNRRQIFSSWGVET